MLGKNEKDLLLRGRRILVVEDQSLVAMEVQDWLEKAGASVAGPVGRLERALNKAETESVDAALLDIDLNGLQCWPVADALRRRGIPFVFTTGFSLDIVMPDRFEGHRAIAKPYKEADILAALVEMLDAAPIRHLAG